MTFLLVLALVLISVWIVFAIIDRIVGWAFARHERRRNETYPQEFLYADIGRMHREVDREVERLAAWVPPAQYPDPTAGATPRARGPYRSRTAAPRLGAPDRQSEYGQSTSLIGTARVEGQR